MERKVGETFTYEGKTYQVVKASLCKNCAFRVCSCESLASITGNCVPAERADNSSVSFKEIENMENNQLTIEVPKGMEIDIKNSNLIKGIIKFKKKSITYEDILQAYIIDYGSLVIPNRNIPKLLAISKLMDIAKYYNKDWRPDWKHHEIKYYIYFDNNDNKYDIDFNDACCRNTIYFKNSKDAKAVIDNPNFRDILDAIYK